MTLLLAAVLVVLVASALCSGSEAALFFVPIIKVRQIAQSKGKSALALLAIRENMSRPIATIVIMNNVVNIGGSLLVGGIAATHLDSRWMGFFSAALTFSVIIFSEIIPKNLGERYCEPIALFIARPIIGLSWLLTPVIWVIERITEPLRKGNPAFTTNESEIKLLARIGREEGNIEHQETVLIQRVFELNDKTAADLMTPRVAMTCLQSEQTLAEAKPAFMNSQHSRIMVIEGYKDQVVGVVYKNELLAAMIDGDQDQPVGVFKHGVAMVPKAKKADALLLMFQRSRQHIAVVLDEFGGVAGVVSLEDVLEILTGEIVDETDKSIDLQEAARNRGKALLS